MSKMSGKETLSKRIQGKLKKGLPKKFTATINSGLNSKLGTRINESAQLASRVATQTAVQTAQIATETAHLAAERVQNAADAAKQSLDHMLIGLEHRGITFKEPTDMAQKIGRKVLERAGEIRAQIASNPFTPSWLKNVSKPHETKLESEPVVEETLHAKFASDIAKEDENGVDIDAPPAKKPRKTSAAGSRAGKSGSGSSRLNK
jgi:hypothetical protein